MEIADSSPKIDYTIPTTWEPAPFEAVRLSAFHKDFFQNEVLNMIEPTETPQFSGIEVVKLLFDAYRRGSNDARSEMLVSNGTIVFTVIEEETGAQNV